MTSQTLFFVIYASHSRRLQKNSGLFSGGVFSGSEAGSFLEGGAEVGGGGEACFPGETLQQKMTNYLLAGIGGTAISQSDIDWLKTNLLE